MFGTLRTALSHLLDGRTESAGIEPPRLYPWDRVRIAARAYDRAGCVFGDRPRTLAARLGIRLVVAPIRGIGCCGGEAATADVVLVAPRPEPREELLLKWHGLAHALLDRERWRATEGDAWLLTLELAAPLAAVRALDLPAAVASAHAPPWLIRRWHPLARRLGAERMAA